MCVSKCCDSERLRRAVQDAVHEGEEQVLKGVRVCKGAGARVLVLAAVAWCTALVYHG